MLKFITKFIAKYVFIILFVINRIGYYVKHRKEISLKEEIKDDKLLLKECFEIIEENF